MDVPNIVVALMVILLLNVRYSQTQDTSECAYTYHEQPSSTLECNPYPNMRLILGCEIRGPSQTIITWFWEPLNSRQPQRLSAARKYSFQHRIVVNRNSWLVRRQLQVRRLDDSDAGWYFCQAELSNGTLLTPSNRLFLDIRSLYRSASICQDEAQANTVPSCARIATDDSTTTASTVSNTPPNAATDSNRGSIDPPSRLPTDGTHRPSLLTDPPSTLPTHRPFLLTATVTLTPMPTMTTVPDPESSMLRVALYSISAVVVVFCATIVTLGFSIVILICRKKHSHPDSKTTVTDQEVGANSFSPDTTRLCACTCRKSGGADIPMEECVAYGTCEQRRKKGDFIVATGECPAYDGVERQQEIVQHNDTTYEYIETPQIAISSQL